MSKFGNSNHKPPVAKKEWSLGMPAVVKAAMGGLSMKAAEVVAGEAIVMIIVEGVEGRTVEDGVMTGPGAAMDILGLGILEPPPMDTLEPALSCTSWTFRARILAFSCMILIFNSLLSIICW